MSKETTENRRAIMARCKTKAQQDTITPHVLAPLSDQVRALLFEVNRRYGVSLKRLANIAEVTPKALSAFIVGESMLPLDSIDKLTNVLRLRIVADNCGTGRDIFDKVTRDDTLCEENLRYLAVMIFRSRTGLAMRSVRQVFNWWICRVARWKRYQKASEQLDRLKATREECRKWDKTQEIEDARFRREWNRNYKEPNLLTGS